MAAVTALPIPPASPFAALLRRSKFASHDPTISQIYTTFGGDAHRGNYGLKRPLSLRKRAAHITVSAVDSRESQTVWKNAEQPSRWIRMWDEVSVSVYPEAGSPWHTKLGNKGELTWMVDSEFGGRGDGPPKYEEEVMLQRIPRAAELREETIAEAKEAGYLYPPMDIDNIHAMSDKEFKAHLEKLRKIRPEFKRFVQTDEATQRNRELPRQFWKISQTNQNLHRHFLSGQMYLKYNSPDSRVIEQQPHLNGGLSYSATSQLQTMHSRKPQPGRVLGRKPQAKSPHAAYVSFAGMVAESNKSQARVKEIDWRTLAISGERNPKRGVSAFTISNATLHSAPSVVGERLGSMMSARLNTVLKDAVETDFSIGNPHTPGSVEYIAHREGKESVPAARIYMPPSNQAARATRRNGNLRESKEHTERVSSGLLATLQNAMGASTQGR